MDSTTKGRRSQGSVVYEQMDRGKGHADTPPLDNQTQTTDFTQTT